MVKRTAKRKNRNLITYSTNTISFLLRTKIQSINNTTLNRLDCSSLLLTDLREAFQTNFYIYAQYSDFHNGICFLHVLTNLRRYGVQPLILEPRCSVVMSQPKFVK